MVAQILRYVVQSFANFRELQLRLLSRRICWCWRYPLAGPWTPRLQADPGQAPGLSQPPRMEWLSELRAQRDALEQELLELEQAAGRQPLRLAAVAGKAMPTANERAAVLLLRLGIVNDALAAVRDDPHQRSDAA